MEKNEQDEFVFKIKDNYDELHFNRNNNFFNQWRKLFEEFSMEFIQNAVLAGADIIRERNSFKKEEKEGQK